MTGYVENPEHVPNPTDMVDNLRTTGIGDTDPTKVAPVFAVAPEVEDAAIPLEAEQIPDEIVQPRVDDRDEDEVKEEAAENLVSADVAKAGALAGVDEDLLSSTSTEAVEGAPEAGTEKSDADEIDANKDKADADKKAPVKKASAKKAASPAK